MIKHLTFVAWFLACSWTSMAQNTEITAGELPSTPPALVSETVTTEPSKAKPSVVTPPRKLSYSLSAGTQFSRLYGTASYLEPSVMFPVTRRFSGFASLTMMTTFGSHGFRNGNEAFSATYASRSNNRVILNAGGNYMVNDRLNLTGSVWRDLTKNTLPAPVNLLMPGGSNGMSLRASYKVTENLSVSGGLRFSNGNSYNNMWYNPGLPYGF